MCDEFHNFEDLLRDEHFEDLRREEDFVDRDEFTNDDVKWALSELMDGVKQHDLPDMTGLSELQCARLFRIAQFATKTRGNFVIGESVRFDHCDDIGLIDKVGENSVYIVCNGRLYTRAFDKVYPCNG